MNRQSQQLVVASVVAFLTSGIITLAGLSAAQDMNMGPPPGDGMGGMQQPMMDMGGGNQQFQPMNDYRPMDQGTPPMFQGAQEHDIGGVRMDFQRDGQDFQRDGINFQRDGINFQKDGPGFQRDGQDFHFGAPDFGGKTGAERGFRGGFEGREGPEREGGRFERKPMEGEMGRFGGQQMAPGKNVEKAGGGLRTRGNFGGEEGRGGFDTSAFDKFMQGHGERKQSKEVSEEELSALDEVLEDDESGITAQEALDAIKAATVAVKGYQSDLKDAKAAVADLVNDDKKLDKLEAQVEQKYGSVEEAPAKVGDTVETLQEEVVEEKEGLQEALAVVDESIGETQAQIAALKEEIADSDLPQESKLLQQCDKLLNQLTKTEASFDKLDIKVEKVEVEADHG